MKVIFTTGVSVFLVGRALNLRCQGALGFVAQVRKSGPRKYHCALACSFVFNTPLCPAPKVKGVGTLDLA